jgi:hypothetical protein
MEKKKLVLKLNNDFTEAATGDSPDPVSHVIKEVYEHALYI